MKKLLFTAIMLIGLFSVSAQLPSVTLKTLDGKTINTAQLNNNGKPFIISFFASWCKPCLRELIAISEVYEEWQAATGVKVVAVCIDDAQNIARIKPMVDEKGWSYEVLLDQNSDFKRALGINLIPAVFIIDGKGKIAYTRTGYTEGSEQHLLEEVRKLLQSK